MSVGEVAERAGGGGWQSDQGRDGMSVGEVAERAGEGGRMSVGEVAERPQERWHVSGGWCIMGDGTFHGGPHEKQ